MTAIQNALISLDGLSVGDAFGQMFFVPDEKAIRNIESRIMPSSPWYLTDDTIMSIGVIETLEKHGKIDPDFLASRFASNYTRNPRRGYGGMAHHILQALVKGENWRTVAPAVFDGSGSYGNGAAMRAAPIGAYFADQPKKLIEQAKSSAAVTHSHQDGIAGAVAVAAVAGWIIRNGPVSSKDGYKILEYAIECVDSGDTKNGIAKALSLPFSYSIKTAVSVLGNGEMLSASDTVPFALWCVARHITDYSDALWTTVSALGDRDTTCAIVGSLVALNHEVTSVPDHWIKSRESLTDWESCDEVWS